MLFLFQLKSSSRFNKYLNFRPNFLVMQKNGLIRKLWLISKFMSQTGQQTITTYILRNISRNEGSQTMKFGLLIEYSKRNIFLEKSYRKCGGKASPRPFYKKSKLSITLNKQSEMLQRLILLNVLMEVCENILKLKY